MVTSWRFGEGSDVSMQVQMFASNLRCITTQKSVICSICFHIRETFCGASPPVHSGSSHNVQAKLATMQHRPMKYI